MDDSSPTEQLLIQAGAGDRAALEALYARYSPRLRRWAAGRLPAASRDLADTHDLVQDTLLQTLRHLPTFEVRGEGAFLAYLRRAILNRINNEVRRVVRKPVPDPLTTEHRASAPSPLEEGLGVSLSAAPPKDIPLSVSYRDLPGDGVRSDGLTSFTGAAAQYVHGPDDNALVIIQSTGNYRFSTRLDARKPQRRRLCFDFGSQQTPFTSAQCVDALIGMHGDGDIQRMAHGEILDKRARHSWSDGVYEYAVGFGTDWNKDGVYDTPPVQVTCVAPLGAAPGGCTAWAMTGDQATLTRAKILSKTKFGPTELMGYYSLPFEASFSR